jgi:hypothetical protein
LEYIGGHATNLTRPPPFGIVLLVGKFLWVFLGFPPGQQFPFAANFLQGSAPKKGVFPPESVDPSLLNQTSQLMNHFNDKAWPYMWFLNRGGRGSHGLDMNVDEAWAQGVSGQSLRKLLKKLFIQI